MSTLVISDMHFGVRHGWEALRRPAALDALLGRLEGVRRLVLLGDLLELRHGPTREALAIAEPPLRALGAALGADAEVVVVPGNHDHALVAGWLDWRGRREHPGPLALEQRVRAEHASWIARRVAALLAPARVWIAYPGLWLRDDVYALHGHYLDAHLAVPTIERLAAGAMTRLLGGLPDPAAPDDYEAVLAPLYALSQASAQRRAPGRPTVSSRSVVGAWRALEAGSRPSARLRGRALGLAFRAGVGVLNRAGIGPLQPHIGVHDLRRASLAALGEVAARLGLAPAHIVFGHTHRGGRLPGDDPAEWRTPGGSVLHNSGNWIFDPAFMGAGPDGSSPYWPGGAIALDGDGPPRLERLLGDVPASTLRAAPPA